MWENGRSLLKQGFDRLQKEKSPLRGSKGSDQNVTGGRAVVTHVEEGDEPVERGGGERRKWGGATKTRGRGITLEKACSGGGGTTTALSPAPFNRQRKQRKGAMTLRKKKGAKGQSALPQRGNLLPQKEQERSTEEKKNAITTQRII